MLRSNCAFLVYGNGKPLTIYLAASVTVICLAVRRRFTLLVVVYSIGWMIGSIPGIVLIRDGLSSALRIPIPPQEEVRNKDSTSRTKTIVGLQIADGTPL
ncbi:hypothetical protein JOM56_000033 [Amanita muscaria]